MLGNQERWQEDIFVACPLRDLVPDDHILKLVDSVLDLSWLKDEVKDLYSEQMGRPSIDPESAVRLMLAGFFQGVVHDRKLMREAQVNLAIRWFAGYRLDEKLPHHSSLTRIRQRWGAERFRWIFERTVAACVDAALVDGKTVHVDATLIRADVSWQSITEQHVEQVLSENQEEMENGREPKSRKASGRSRGKAPKRKKRSTTDPDATMVTNRSDQRLEPSYKQHTAVDDKAAVIVDVEVTTGELNEGTQLTEQLERIESNTGTSIQTLTADASYAHASNYDRLERRDIDPVIPPQRVRANSKHISSSRFKYDAKHDVVRCPRSKPLTRRTRSKNGWFYRTEKGTCIACPLCSRCSHNGRSRSILIVDGYQALTRARRRHRIWDTRTRSAYQRHRWKVEGVHGESKTQHGLRRAVRRNLANVAIQAYLTAAVINLKRLATAASGPFNHLLTALKVFIHAHSHQNMLRFTITNRPAHEQKRNWKSRLTPAGTQKPDFFNSPSVPELPEAS